jgi:hypothetical protein
MKTVSPARRERCLRVAGRPASAQRGGEAERENRGRAPRGVYALDAGDHAGKIFAPIAAFLRVGRARCSRRMPERVSAISCGVAGARGGGLVAVLPGDRREVAGDGAVGAARAGERG